MTGQNFMLNLLANQPTAVHPASNQESRKTDYDKSNYSKFSDVLAGTVNKTPVNKPSPKRDSEPVQKNSEELENQEQQPKFKTFKEVKENDKTNTAEETNTPEDKSKLAAGASGNASDVKDVKETDSSKDNAAVSALAQVLGIPQQDLMKLLKSLNIKPEDLTDNSKSGEVLDKLSSLMNLNASQKQTLGKILDTLKEIVNTGVVPQDLKTKPQNLEQDEKVQVKNTQAKNEVNAVDSKNADWVKLDNPNITVVKQQDLSEEINKFKAGLELLTKKLQQNPEQVMGDITAEIKDAVVKSETNTAPVSTVKTDTDTVESKSKELKPTAAEPEGTPDEQNKTGMKNESDTKSQVDVKTVKSAEPKIAAVEAVHTDAVKVDNNTQLQQNPQIPNQVQKADDLNPVAKIPKDIPVSKNEIINQVVEKAKVTLTGDKSEMSMDLKPDNLGKLSLKIVTERGIVAAKFVAESHQVKETLEANMQTLKDSLEKQGLSVQNVSVSVQQDPYRGGGKQFETGDNRNQARGKNDTTSIGMVSVSNEPEIQKKINAYNWSNSSINLTA